MEEEYLLKEGEHSQECITCKKELPITSFWQACPHCPNETSQGILPYPPNFNQMPSLELV